LTKVLIYDVMRTGNLLLHFFLIRLNLPSFLKSEKINSMKHSKIFSAISFSVLLISLTIFGCKKETDDKKELEYDTQSSGDNTLAENSWNDVAGISDQAVENGSGTLTTYRNGDGGSYLSTCATVTFDTAAWSKSVTVNFGSSFCLCSDGRYRRGQFHISWTGGYRDSAAVITTSANVADNYCVKYITDTAYWVRVTGTRTVTNKGHNASGHLWYTVSVSGTLYNSSSQSMTWSSNRTREWTDGESTLTWSDDKYSITGTADGRSFEGSEFHVEIKQALIVDFTCFASNPGSCKITKGKFELTPSGKVTRYFDFGNGACDNTGVLTVNGVDFTIYIR
jgi:hypothetical protein